MKSNKKEGTVAEITRELLELKPFLRELMDIGAVNYRGLARHLLPDIKDKLGGDRTVNIDSIVMAIRRYEEEEPIGKDMMKSIEKVIANSEISLRSDIVYYTFPRSRKFHKIALDSYEAVENQSGDRYYILQSDSEIGLIVDRKNSELVEGKIEEFEAKKVDRELAMVVMDSPEEVLESDGFLSFLTERIIMNGIGLIDMFTTYTETVFLVRDKDSARLYEVLRGLVRDMREKV